MRTAAAEAGSLYDYQRYAVNRLIRHTSLPAPGVSCMDQYVPQKAGRCYGKLTGAVSFLQRGLATPIMPQPCG